MQIEQLSIGSTIIIIIEVVIALELSEVRQEVTEEVLASTSIASSTPSEIRSYQVITKINDNNFTQ